MTTDVPVPPPAPRRWLWGLLIFGVLVVLALACLLGYCWDSNHGEGVIIGATIGTALGTLALAGTTYALARATRQTVREAGAELEELKSQGRLVAEQARIAAEQAEETARMADASKQGANAAEKARIDAISPLVHCVATFDGLKLTNRDRAQLPITVGQTWYSAELEDLRFTVTLKFVLTNVGRAPARLTFGDTSTFLTKVAAKGTPAVELDPGAAYIDQYDVDFTSAETTHGKYVRMPFTYDGIMHGEMSDRIQWNGWVTPLAVVSEGIAKQNARIVNASGAQVIRDYPNLERPDEMAEARKKLLSYDDPSARTS